MKGMIPKLRRKRANKGTGDSSSNRRSLCFGSVPHQMIDPPFQGKAFDYDWSGAELCTLLPEGSGVLTALPGVARLPTP